VAKIASQPRFTRTGMLKGKLAYMPPEQLHGEPVDRQLDVFALGVVLYELLCAHRPFEGPSEAAVIRAILDDEPAPLESRRHGVAPELARIVQTALAKKKAERYPDCEAMLRDLERYLAGADARTGAAEIAALVRPLLDPRPATQGGLAPLGSLGPVSLPTPPPRKPDVEEHLSTETLATGVPTAVHRLARPATLESPSPARTPTALQRFAVTFEGSAENLLARLTAQYGEHTVAVEPGATDFAVVTQAGRRTMIKREPEAEAEAIHAVTALGLRFKPVLGRFQMIGEPAVDLLANARSRFPAAWRVELGKVRFAPLPPLAVALQVDFDGKAFSLQASFQSGAAQVAPAHVFEAHRAGRRQLKLAEGYAPLGPLGEALELLLALGARASLDQRERVAALLARVPAAQVSEAARGQLG